MLGPSTPRCLRGIPKAHPTSVRSLRDRVPNFRNMVSNNKRDSAVNAGRRLPPARRGPLLPPL
eukprot:7850380-Lingulodinium_polyedra.AAC.1